MHQSSCSLDQSLNHLVKCLDQLLQLSVLNLSGEQGKWRADEQEPVIACIRGIERIYGSLCSILPGLQRLGENEEEEESIITRLSSLQSRFKFRRPERQRR
ncbi:hypothetical protein LINPERPRIM_LOCUS19283 [Linum perenne]